MAADERPHPFGEPVSFPPLPNQPSAAPIYLDEDERKSLDRLIEAEPDIIKGINRQRALTLIWEVFVKLAVGLSALSGGFFVLREIIKGMAK